MVGVRVARGVRSSWRRSGGDLALSAVTRSREGGGQRTVLSGLSAAIPRLQRWRAEFGLGP